jgi:hypothetical protein
MASTRLDFRVEMQQVRQRIFEVVNRACPLRYCHVAVSPTSES